MASNRAVAFVAASFLTTLCLGAITDAQSAATQPSAPSADLTSLSLEDLMNVQVTSVSLHAQKLSEAPAAITVIRPDDIRDSGLNSIPELLRLAPGMDVQQVNANRWAITSRGFNGLFADDLLVLMDGRSVYTLVFGGVRWNAIDYPLADLDRIEVIRGPGATVWGSNAVNGVVNITTKSADQTQGLLVDSQLSTEQAEQSVRYGGKIDDNTYYRVYSKVGYADSGKNTDNTPSHDEWSSYQGGFRIDRFASPKDTLTLQGDAHYQQLDDVTNVLVTADPRSDDENGENILGRWTHTDSDRASTTLQAYYDRNQAGDFPANTQEDSFDIDFQNRLPLGENQELTWGLGARDTELLYGEFFPNEFTPSHWSDYLYSGFVQDQITLLPNTLQWYLGTKLEYTRLTKFEVQPGTRLLWTPDDRNSVWAAVSRSLRQPSLFQDTTLDIGGFDSTHGDVSSEQLISYELGYKVQPSKTFTVDWTGFYNSYRDLISYTPLLTPNFIPYGVSYNNDLSAHTYGTEISANWQATDAWRLAASYSYLRVVTSRQGLLGPMVPQAQISYSEGSTPRNQFQLHSYLEITKNLGFNASAYYEDALPTINLPPQDSQKVPSFVRADANVVWRPGDHMTATTGVRNLLQNRHSESGNFNSLVQNSQAERRYFVECELSY